MNRKSKVALVLGGAFLLPGLILWLVFFWTTHTFHNLNILTIVLYLTNPLTGVEKRYLFNAGLLVFVVLLAFVLIMVWIKRRSVGAAGVRRSLVFLAASIVVFASSLYAIDRQFQIIEFIFVPERYSSYIDDNYAMFSPDEMTFENGKSNLIMVVLESMDGEFVDGALFSPPIMPHCAELEKEAVVFRGHRQVMGTDYSTAGFTCMMLGIPAMPPLNMREMVANVFSKEKGKSLLELDKREWRDYSVMGLLEQKGYDVCFFTGADISFGGFGNLARSMTKDLTIRDYTYFLENREDVTEKDNGWGLNDGFLYARAKEHLAALSGDRPFFMLLQTLDTHSPGYYEPGMERPFGDARDTFFQADRMLLDFLGWIRSQPFSENTTVVFVGDHLYPPPSLGSVTLPPRSERGIMCTFFNARGRPGPEEIRRTFATFDVAPTLLEAAGASFPERRFGLGVSLFSPRQTLLEKDGVAKFNKEALSRSRANEERYGW